MYRIIIKYQQFIFSLFLYLVLHILYKYGLQDPINIFIYPLFIGFLFLIISENRSRDQYFRDELSKIHKYFDNNTYSETNPCPINGCELFMELKDFIEKFRCSNLSNLDKKIYDEIYIFLESFGDDIKYINNLYSKPIPHHLIIQIISEMKHDKNMIDLDNKEKNNIKKLISDTITNIENKIKPKQTLIDNNFRSKISEIKNLISKR